MKDTFRKTYKQLSAENATLVNEIKEVAEQLEELFYQTNPSRELSLALTNLEQSIMWATKAVCINNDGQKLAEETLRELL